MIQNTLLPEDPKLTAYALGELEGAELAAVEAALRQNPEARATVEGIRATAAHLSAALATEPMPAVKPAPAPSLRHAAIVEGRDPSKLDGGPLPYPGNKLIKFPQFYYVVGLTAAACFAVMVALYKPTPHPAPVTVTREYTEVTFAPPSASADVESPSVSELKYEAPTAVALADEIKPEVRSMEPPPMKILLEENALAVAKAPEAPIVVSQNPLSTFSINTDTASYATVRRFLQHGTRPPRDAVRIEGLLNYFSYSYPQPSAKDDKPFAASLEVASAPWSPAHRLVRIGLKGRETEQESGTRGAIAKDVKVQVEFNPAKVASYRLIGYENDQPKKENSKNDKVDSNEVGAGRTVTALYEVVPVDAGEKPGSISPLAADLKYQHPPAPDSRLEMLAGKTDAASNEMLTVKVRYKKPDGIVSRKLEFPLTDKGALFADASSDFKFAAAVAGFGMILRESPHKGTVTFGDVIDWAGPTADKDPGGQRGEFVGLVRQAQSVLR